MKMRPQSPVRHRSLRLAPVLAFALLAPPLSPAPAQESPPPGEGCFSREIISERTRDMKVFATADCSYTALFGHYLHYEAAPGQWEDVDLRFEQQGGEYVMEEHVLSVHVHGTSLEVADQESGKGIRWIIPGPPSVAGRSATFSDKGLDWQYSTRKTGIKLEAEVTSAQGPRTYDYTYHLVGGASDLIVDVEGNLLSDAFTVPRAVALGSDGQTYPAPAWQLLPGNRVAFDFDDSTLPAEAFPYVLDPTTLFDLGGPDAQSFTSAESGDDGMVSSFDSLYPPLIGEDVDTGASYVQIRRDSEYEVSNGLMRWDTSTLPDTARVLDAVLQVSPARSSLGNTSCPVESEDHRQLTATGTLRGR